MSRVVVLSQYTKQEVLNARIYPLQLRESSSKTSYKIICDLTHQRVFIRADAFGVFQETSSCSVGTEG